MKRLILVLIATLALSVAAAAQMEQPIANREAGMKKLAKLVGTWKGSGWYIGAGGKREKFTRSEVVQSKIDGLAILAEGKHLSLEGKVVHETLAVLSYDEGAKIYKFAWYLAGGLTGSYDLRIVPDGYEWGYRTPQGGTIRYLIKADADTWFETGEYSRDGKTWAKIFEMKLDRVK